MARVSAESEFDRFTETHPAYAETSRLDDFRRDEFGRLDATGQVYLDYTGGSLYAARHVTRHLSQLAEGVFGNPHSLNPPSRRSTALVESCRKRILRFFKASPKDYVVVFTANASHALKLVGESYPFRPDDRFLLTFDNHNSVNGIREFDRVRGAQTLYVPVLPPDLRADESVLLARLEANENTSGHNLFAYPAQSNFSGVRHPLQWIDVAHEGHWDVLLDAAAFVPTNRLDLSRWSPDFVAMSFYKMFGYPTGVGALVARRSALDKLHRPWFAGGTVSVASVQGDRHHFAAGAPAFEDGTIDYLNIPAVEMGLDLIDQLDVDLIQTRVGCLTAWLLEELSGLRHTTGRRLARIYGPLSSKDRGGTVAFNFYDASGAVISHDQIEQLAADQGIALRTGCFCNPGAGEVALGVSQNELTRCFRESQGRMEREDLMRCIDAESTGAVRVSLGWASNFGDVHRFLAFAGALVS